MLTRIQSLLFLICGRQMKRSQQSVWGFAHLRRTRIALNVFISAASLLILLSPVNAQDVTINFVSDTTWTVTDTNGNSLGNAQNVCLNSTAPPNCPTGSATLYGYPGFAWTANLSSIPGATWIWAPQNSALQNITGATTGAAGATFTFTKQFYICGTPKAGTISVASDNTAQVFLNGATTPIVTSTDWSALTTVTVPASSFAQGLNIIQITAMNAADPPDCTSDQYQCNPAGVVLGASFSDLLNKWPQCSDRGQTFNVGSIETLPCPAGQVGSEFRTCACLVGNAIWTPVTNACENTCKGNNGQLFTPGQTETLPCPAGQTGSQSHICQQDGSWGPTTGTCQPPPPTCIGNNGQDNGQVFQVGQTQPIPCPAGKVGSLTETCQSNGTWSAPSGNCSCPAGAPACGTSCCTAGQLCCRVNGVSACVTPGGPRSGHPWCGQSAPTVIECNNCTSTQTCGSICGGQLCSVDWYCQ